MLGFSPFKKRPTPFNYIPRYYDPETEARDERRAELHGRRAADDGQEYTPGQFIRTRAQARADHLRAQRSKGMGRIWIMMLLGAAVVLFMLFGYPRVVTFISNLQNGTEGTQPAVEEFDTYRPITVVPNDYEE